jgi:hypothetical protein
MNKRRFVMEKFEAFTQTAGDPLGLVFYSADEGVTISDSPRRGEAGELVGDVFPEGDGWTIRPVEE